MVCHHLFIVFATITSFPYSLCNIFLRFENIRLRKMRARKVKLELRVQDYQSTPFLLNFNSPKLDVPNVKQFLQRKYKHFGSRQRRPFEVALCGRPKSKFKLKFYLNDYFRIRRILYVLKIVRV